MRTADIAARLAAGEATPGMILRRILTILQTPLAAIPLGGGRRCVICDHRVGWFLPYEGGSRYTPALSQALEVVGSDVDHFQCPRCRSHDRERHLFLYLARSGLLEALRGQTVVHFAPEHHIARVIATCGPARYVKCDLFPSADDVRREDLTAMSFASGSIDLLIANHVLEHVGDDRAAVAEIARVLKPGGLAILQTPYSPVLEKTWGDAGVTSPEGRLQAFGQADHVRQFGRDIFQRIEEAGLASRVRHHEDLLSDVDARAVGVNAREPFFLFEKA